jgi:hypothetical protein
MVLQTSKGRNIKLIYVPYATAIGRVYTAASLTPGNGRAGAEGTCVVSAGDCRCAWYLQLVFVQGFGYVLSAWVHIHIRFLSVKSSPVSQGMLTQHAAKIGRKINRWRLVKYQRRNRQRGWWLQILNS